MSDIVERLNEEVRRQQRLFQTIQEEWGKERIKNAELTAENERLDRLREDRRVRHLACEAENARLREALEPFAAAWSGIPPEVFKWLSLAQLGKIAAHEVSGTHFQRASAALTEKEPRT